MYKLFHYNSSSFSKRGRKVGGQKIFSLPSNVIGQEDEKIEKQKTMKNEISINLQLYSY